MCREGGVGQVFGEGERLHVCACQGLSMRVCIYSLCFLGRVIRNLQAKNSQKCQSKCVRAYEIEREKIEQHMCVARANVEMVNSWV